VIGFVASSPYFRWDGETVSIFAKNLTVPSFADVSQPSGSTCESGKIFFRKRDNALHFSEKYASLYPFFFRKRGGLAEQVSSNSVARFTIYRSPDGAAGTERTQRCYGEWRNSSRLVITDFARMWWCNEFSSACFLRPPNRGIFWPNAE